MRTRSIGGIAALVTVAALVAKNVPPILLDDWTAASGGFPAWLPRLDTVGQTVTIYETLANLVSVAVLLVLAVGLGALIARTHETPASREVVTALLAGSTAGLVVPSLGFILYAGTFDLAVFDVLVVATGLLWQFVAVTLVLVLGAVAGATITRTWSRPGDRPPQSVTPGTAGDRAD